MATKKKLATTSPLVGEAPAGKLDAAALDAACKQWAAIPNKRSSDYCNYGQDKLVADLEEMIEGTEDLPLFKKKETPITARDFAWLALLNQGFTDLGDEVLSNKGAAKSLELQSNPVVRRVLDARLAISRRAEASGVPTSLFAVTRYDSLSALHAQCSRAARQAQRQLKLGTFVGSGYVTKAIAELETALKALKTLADARESAGSDSKTTSTRRMALKFLAYEAMTRLAPWGRDAVGDDPDKAGRYTLDHVFEHGTSHPPAPGPVPPAPTT